MKIRDGFVCRGHLGRMRRNNSDTLARKPMSTLEQDRQLVTMGIFRPSVLETDAELEKISPNSPRALQPLRQKLAATQLQQNRLQAEEALHPPATATSQPEDQQQRMCSLNNRAAVYLVPC